MEYLIERVAYLRGLADGMNISEDTNEGKLLINIIDVLEDISEAMTDMDYSQDELREDVDDVLEDLAELEHDFYEEDGCSCGDYDYDEEEDIAYYEVECPHCFETVYLDEDMLDTEEDEELTCPNCKEPIDIEFENDLEYEDEDE